MSTSSTRPLKTGGVVALLRSTSRRPRVIGASAFRLIHQKPQMTRTPASFCRLQSKKTTNNKNAKRQLLMKGVSTCRLMEDMYNTAQHALRGSLTKKSPHHHIQTVAGTGAGGNLKAFRCDSQQG